MKKIITSVLCVLCLLNLVSAQLVRTGNFVENAAIYPISGDVTVTLDAGMVRVDFENNFSSVQGISLEVFLSRSNTLNTQTDLLISTAPLDAGTAMGTPITGARIFIVPAGTNLYEYDNVLVQCTVADVLWGHANLCETTLQLTTSPLPSDSYHAEDTIVSNAILTNDSDITFEAQNLVSLETNFEASSTSNLNVMVGSNKGCAIE